MPAHLGRIRIWARTVSDSETIRAQFAEAVDRVGQQDRHPYQELLDIRAVDTGVIRDFLAEQPSRTLGEDARSQLDRCLPGAFDEAVANADQFFQVELPAAAQWSFGRDDARLVDQPILNVVGTETVPRFVETAAMVQSLFPDAVRVELSGAGHLLMAQEPTTMATRLAEFWS